MFARRRSKATGKISSLLFSVILTPLMLPVRPFFGKVGMSAQLHSVSTGENAALGFLLLNSANCAFILSYVHISSAEKSSWAFARGSPSFTILIIKFHCLESILLASNTVVTCQTDCWQVILLAFVHKLLECSLFSFNSGYFFTVSS